MILGSHNSWSYLKPYHWWLRPFAFIARCQSVDIKTQYEKYGVRCFDLRIRVSKEGRLLIAHGSFRYDYAFSKLLTDLYWINSREDCYVRVLHESRSKSQHTDEMVRVFQSFCKLLEDNFHNIYFWCGRNLYDWGYDYHFSKSEPLCFEAYSSVCAPKFIDDWWPWLFAYRNNRRIIEQGTDMNILLVDFVNIR